MAKRYTKEDVEGVMRFAKCSEDVARYALKATKGKFAESVIVARKEAATRSVPTGPEFTAEDLAKAWA